MYVQECTYMYLGDCLDRCLNRCNSQRAPVQLQNPACVTSISVLLLLCPLMCTCTLLMVLFTRTHLHAPHSTCGPYCGWCLKTSAPPPYFGPSLSLTVQPTVMSLLGRSLKEAADMELLVSLWGRRPLEEGGTGKGGRGEVDQRYVEGRGGRGE